MWCIPPKQVAAFVCAMEQVLDVYPRPHDPAYPVICMDETTKQCVKETRVPQPSAPGRAARYDADTVRDETAAWTKRRNACTTPAQCDSPPKMRASNFNACIRQYQVEATTSELTLTRLNRQSLEL